MAHALDITQARRSVRPESAHDLLVAAVIGFWLAAVLTTWMLVGLVVAAIWRVVT